MGRTTFRKSLFAIGVLASVTIGSFFTSANERNAARHSHFNINYNDDTYDSTYILSPVSSLNATTGSNYYIIVGAYDTVAQDTQEDLTVATALYLDSRAQNNSFIFPFVDQEQKTIDVRELGAEVGSMIFAYVEEELASQTVGGTFTALFSLNSLSYVKAENAPTSGDITIEYEGTTNIMDATSWTISNTTDTNGVNCFTFLQGESGNYLHDESGYFTYSSDGSNNNLYLYSISQSLARELSYSILANYINDLCSDPDNLPSEDTLNGLFCKLPYYQRDKFRRQTYLMDAPETTSDGTFYTSFYYNTYNGLQQYKNIRTEDIFLGPSVDVDSLDVNYAKGYITGFSPFECFVAVATTESIAKDMENAGSYSESQLPFLGFTNYSLPTEQRDRQIPYNYTAHYRDQKLYLMGSGQDTAPTSFYGTTLTFSYGEVEVYNLSELYSQTFETLTTDANPAEGINVQLKIATTEGLDGGTINCIFDEEIQLEQIGGAGDYEYALVASSLYDSWSNYYMHANLDAMTWQTDPVFHTYQTQNGQEAIGEEEGFVAYVRKAAVNNGNPSPVLAVLEDIMPANYEDGYILRMNLLNEQCYNQYTTNYQGMYNDLTSDPNFEVFNLESLHSEANQAIESIENRDVAKASTDLRNVEVLEVAYEVNVYMHTQIYENYLEAFSDNQTTRSLEVHTNLINELAEMTFDYSQDAETLKASVDAVIASYEDQLSLYDSLDELCQQLISYLNSLLETNRDSSTSSALWEIFKTAFWDIHNAQTLEDAQEIYQTAISDMNEAVE